MPLHILLALAGVLLFALGVLYGCARETRRGVQRDKRLAQAQREINVKVRILRALGQLDANEARRLLTYEIKE